MVIIFVGVPGSGKSTIAKILVEKLEERGSQFFRYELQRIANQAVF